jgi:hypothetical protein
MKEGLLKMPEALKKVKHVMRYFKAVKKCILEEKVSFFKFCSALVATIAIACLKDP